MTRTKKALPKEDNQKAPEVAKTTESPEVTQVEPSAPSVADTPVEAMEDTVEEPADATPPVEDDQAVVAEVPLPVNPAPVKEVTITIGGSTRRDN